MLGKWLLLAAWHSDRCLQQCHWLRLCVSGQISQHEKEKFNKLWRAFATNYISHKPLFPLLCASQNKGAERRWGKEFTVRRRGASDLPIPLVITFPLETQLPSSRSHQLFKGRGWGIWRIYFSLFGRKPESWTRMCFLCLIDSSTRWRASNSILISHGVSRKRKCLSSSGIPSEHRSVAFTSSTYKEWISFIYAKEHFKPMPFFYIYANHKSLFSSDFLWQQNIALLIPMCTLHSQKLREDPGRGKLTMLWDGCFRVLAASRPQLHEHNCDT